MHLISFNQLARFVILIDSNFWTGYRAVLITIANGCDVEDEVFVARRCLLLKIWQK
jgi:hypothetical protein